MDRIRNTLLAVLAIAPLVAGCMPDTPRTHLEWGVDTSVGPKRVAGRSAKTYVYQDAKPTARPTPNYVTKDAAPYAPVTRKELAPAGAPAFAWPISGRVLSDFGATSSGGRNDGINIAAISGAPIHASAGGTVTYAGSELKNYGNLVLIKHSGGYTTAYAHADKLLVSRGDYVARGQTIGYAGQTGDVTTPQLHFEIRAATTPVNPRSYLSTTSASN